MVTDTLVPSLGRLMHCKHHVMKGTFEVMFPVNFPINREHYFKIK